ncbi:DUF7882 family protein [Nocardia thraciensis]
MAQLQYNPNGSNSVKFDGIENDALVVLQRVMEERFSRGEGFWLEWDGNAVWLHPSIPILLNYDEDQPIRYSREAVANWVKESAIPLGLSRGTNSTTKRLEVIDPDWQPLEEGDEEDADSTP